MVNIVYNIVSAAGGCLKGKVRLQKAAYLAELAGFSDDLGYRYYHFGPYSDVVTEQVSDAVYNNLVDVVTVPTEWGGKYTEFLSREVAEVPEGLGELVRTACGAESVILELAATAAFLKDEYKDDCWNETARRKPLKASPERLASARQLWESLRAVKVPQELPRL